VLGTDARLRYADDETLRRHAGGKIEVRLKTPLETRDDLARVYTPGFAHAAAMIAAHPDEVWRLTIKANAVAVVTDGSAVSGIGDVGPEAALPVMEGKAMLFKRFAGIDAVPICLATQDVDEIVRVVRALEPSFGAVMLEDIAAPRCFEIEERLERELGIPVMHDDQHGTAVVAAAALINALELIGKKVEDLKVVVAGVGAAGTACAKMFAALGVRRIVGCDRTGAIHRGRGELSGPKRWFAEHANPAGERGSVRDVLAGADVFIGVSGPGVIDASDVRSMSRDPIVFALANPTPELHPDDVRDTVAVIATGRSDFPNQIDNGLCYPGIFRAALDCRARRIDDAMKLAAAHALAGAVDRAALDREHVVPDIFTPGLADLVAAAVTRAALASGSARTA
jgi:malate dehydrogenase (oxaloacetate-decarboxylating)